MTAGELVNCQTCNSSFVEPRARPTANVAVLVSRFNSLSRSNALLSGNNPKYIGMPNHDKKSSCAAGAWLKELAIKRYGATPELGVCGEARPVTACGPIPSGVREFGAPAELVWERSTRLTWFAVGEVTAMESFVGARKCSTPRPVTFSKPVTSGADQINPPLPSE